MAKLGDLYLGVIDFFSIMLPGALLTASIVSFPGVMSTPPLPALIDAGETAQWLAFAVCSYALGHFLFPVAARLDGFLYDPYRKRKWPDSKSFIAARDIRVAFFGNAKPACKDDPMNTFKWAKATLMLRAPAALADVNRYEADSKFFRSLAVVLPVVAWVLVFRQQIGPSLAALALTYLSFVCYADRRQKSTEWAYIYALVLELGSNATAPAVAQPTED